MKNIARSRFIFFCSAGYAFFAAMWIYFSDQLLAAVLDPSAMVALSTVKGFVFIVVTTGLLFMALQIVPAEHESGAPPEVSLRVGPYRVLLALLVPVLAFVVQWAFWDVFSPYAWFLFYPAVFVSSWIGGLAGGMLAAVLSTLLVWYFFIPPTFTFALERPLSLFSIGIFMGTGMLFSLTHERLRRAEQRAAEAKFRSLVEQSLVGIYIIQDGLFRYANPGLAQIFGYAAADQLLDRMPVADLVAPADRAKVAENMRRRAEGEVESLSYVFNGLRRDGSPVQVEVHGRSFVYQGRPAVIGVAIDISERQHAEAALRHRGVLLNQMGRLATVGGWEFEVATGRVEWTDEVAKIHDLDTDQAISVERGLQFYSEASRPLAEQAVQEACEQATPFDLELEMVSARGVRKWVRTVGEPVLENGRVSRVQGAIQDITERKRAELEVRRLNADLEQRVAERTRQLAVVNKELESFTYSVSHDLKAPLRGIDGYSRLLQQECAAGLNAECQTFVQNIRQGAEQMSSLIDDLLAYSRMERRTLQSRLIDLPRLVQSVLAERREEIDRLGAQLSVEVPAVKVDADMEGLATVLRNLLENALKFHRPAVPPVLEIGGRADEKTVTLWVRDNGIGFDMKFHERIFEIFQRLQRAEEFPGTGIGLALVRKAMHRLGGRVWAESVPGQGSTFYLEMPR